MQLVVSLPVPEAVAQKWQCLLNSAAAVCRAAAALLVRNTEAGVELAVVSEGAVDRLGAQRTGPDIPSLLAAANLVQVDAFPVSLDDASFGTLVIADEEPGSIEEPCRTIIGNLRDAIQLDLSSLVEERALRERQVYRTEQVFELARIGFWEYDLERQVYRGDDSLYDVMGFDRGHREITDAMLAKRLEEAGFQRIKQKREAARQERAASQVYDIETVGDDGERRMLRIFVQNEFDENGDQISRRGAVQDVTEFHRLEAGMGRAQRILDLCAEAAGIVVWEYDLEHDTVNFNAVNREAPSPATGLVLPAETDLTLERFLEETHPDDHPTMQTVIETLRKGVEESLHFEHRLRRTDGEWRWLLSVGRGIGEGSEPGSRAYGISVDITPQKEAETELRARAAALKKRETLLRFTTRLGRCGAWEYDLATDRIRSSPEASELFGYPLDLEQPLEFFISLVGESHREAVRRGMERTLTEGVDYRLEHPITRGDGTTAFVRQRAKAVRNAEGAIVGVWGVIQDISEEAREEKRRNLLWGLAKAAFWEYDVKEHIFRGEPGISDMLELPDDRFRYTEDEITQLIHPDDRDAYVGYFVEARKQHLGDFEAGCRIQVGGKTKYVRTIVHQEFGADGELVERYGINMDVTDRERVAAIIERIATEAVVDTDDSYLRQLAGSVAGILDADLVAVTRMTELPNRSETLAVCYEGKLLENTRYDPRQSVCFKVISGNEFIRARGAAGERLEFLPSEHRLEAILGVAVKDSRSRHVGEFLIGFRQPLTNLLVMEQLARLCAVRVGVFLEQREVERRLRESEALFRDIAENSIFAVRILQDGRCVYCNHRYAELVGRSPEELTGMRPQDYISPASYRKLRKYLEMADKGHAVTYESELVLLDRRRVWCTVQARPIRYRGRKACLAVMLDISDRKRMEIELREAAERFALAAEIGRIDVWDWNVKTDEFSLTFGHRGRHTSQEPAVVYSGRDRLEWIHPEDRRMVGYRIGRTLSGEVDVFAATYRSTYPGVSGWRWVSARGKIVEWDTEGIPRRMLGMQRDVTEEKEAEFAVREQEERLRLTTEAAGLGTWEWNPTTGATSASDQWFEMVGFEGKEKPKHIDFWFENLHPDDKPAMLALIDRQFRGEEDSFSVDFRFWNPKKGWIWLHGSGKIMERNAAGAPTRMLGTHQDITEKKENERRLAEQAEQLRHAQKMEAVGELAGGVAHEFNNLLQVISGYGELLEDALTDRTEASEHLKAVMGASRRGAELVRQLMQFSHKEPVALRAVDLPRLVSGMLGMLRRVLGENIELHLKPASPLPVILADEAQLGQVIMNLCLNARDAIGSQGGRITIEMDCRRLDAETEPAMPAGEYLVLSVEDTGAGMSGDVRQRIFDPFFTTKEVGKGTGLGLSAVLGIVEYHEGSITVESEPEKGTVFHVFLPVPREVPAEEPPAEEQEPPIPPTSGETPRTTVLVAEDNPFVLELAVHSLSKLGFNAVAARDGDEAVELFRRYQDRIGLLLLDIIMPRRNGPQVYRDICDLGFDLPVIFATGYGDTFVELDPVPTRHAFLAKPFNRRSLQKAIGEVWGQGVACD